MGRLHAMALGGPEQYIKTLAKTDRDAAFDVMIRTYMKPLVVHAVGIVRNQQEAEDIAAETFMRAMSEERMFNEGFGIQAWLYRVATNMCLNTLRNVRRRGELRGIYPNTIMPGALRSTRSIVFERERSNWISRYLDQLSDDHRQIILLRYWEGMTYEEIRQTLGCKLGTVMSRLHRAHKRLNLLMQGSGEELISAPRE